MVESFYRNAQSFRFYLSGDKKKYLHYEVIKNVVPQTTLFIHGNLSSNRWWDPLFKSFSFSNSSALMGDIICAEIRGCGRSSDVDPSEEITIFSLSEEFIQLIRGLNLANLNVVGHSTGGSIALVMLTQMSNCIRRAVLIDPVGARGRAFEPATIKTFQRMQMEPDLVAEVMQATITAPEIDTNFFENIVVPDAIRAARVIGLKIARAFADFNVMKLLDRVSSPVLIIHGDQDRILPLTDSEELAQLLPHGSLEILSGIGHCPNLQDPSRLWLHLKRFLGF